MDNKKNKKAKLIYELYRANHLEEAVLQLENIIATEPENPDLLNLLGTILLDLGELERAARCFKKAFQRDPENSSYTNSLCETMFKIAQNFFKNNEYSSAINELNKLIKLNPKHPHVHNFLGTCFQKTGEIQFAIDNYTAAIKQDPTNHAIYNNLGILLAEIEENELAIIQLRKALEIKPEMIEVKQNLAHLLKRVGNVEEAIKIYREILEIQPHNSKITVAINALQAITPKKMSNEYVTDLFDNYATHYDDQYYGYLKNRTPNLIETFIRRYDSGYKATKGIDLGCGTGKCGEAFRERVKNLVGIDLSREMLAVARQKNIYKSLIIGDFCKFLRTDKSYYDLVVASDVFFYVGDLDELFELVRLRCSEDAIFAFSTEHTNQKGYKLLTSSRYAHSLKYVRGISRKYGFHELHFSVESLREEKGEWIQGGIYILQKKNLKFGKKAELLLENDV